VDVEPGVGAAVVGLCVVTGAGEGVGAGSWTPEPSTAMSAQFRNSSPHRVSVLELFDCSKALPQVPHMVPHQLDVSQPS